MPSTMTTLAPATAQAYPIDPRMSSLTAPPATLTLKVSPMPRSEITSTGVRESMQERTMAAGYCPAELDFISPKKSLSRSAGDEAGVAFHECLDHLIRRHGIALRFGQHRTPRPHPDRRIARRKRT